MFQAFTTATTQQSILQCCISTFLAKGRYTDKSWAY